MVRTSRAGSPTEQEATRQGDVDGVARESLLELRGVELGGTPLQQRLQRFPDLVARFADRAAFGLGQLRDPPQDPGELGLAPQEADPQLLEPRRCRRQRRSRLPPPSNCSIRSVASAIAVLRHVRSGRRRYPLQGDRSRRCDVQGLGARSRGIVTLQLDLSRTSAGSPSRSAPRQIVAGPLSDSIGSPP